MARVNAPAPEEPGGNAGPTFAPMRTLADRLIRRLRADMTEIAEETLRRMLGNIIRGGYVRGDRISPPLPGHNLWSATHPDTDTTDTPADGDVITWSATAGKWVASAPAGGGGATILADTYANRPAAGTVGRLYRPTDGCTTQRDDGTAWRPWGPLFALTEPPALNQWTWVNQGGATAFSGHGTIHLATASEVGYQWRCLTRPAPVTPYTITACIAGMSVGAAANVDPRAAVLFRDSATGRLVTVEISHNDPMTLPIAKWNSPSSFNSNYATPRTASWLSLGWHWVRIGDDGTNRTVALSIDGQNFYTIHTVARTDFLTANQIGIGVTAGINGANRSILQLLSWRES